MILCILFWKPSKCDCFPGEIKHSKVCHFFFLFSFFFFTYRCYFCCWSIVDLQCCVNFWCIAKWFLFILFPLCLSQNTDHSSQCYTRGPCCLSSLYIIACVCVCSVPQSCPHLCRPMDCSLPGFPFPAPEDLPNPDWTQMVSSISCIGR